MDEEALVRLALLGVIKLDTPTLILLVQMISLKNQKIRKFPTNLLNINELSDSFCLEQFRFTKQQLFQLKQSLRIPDTLCCRNGTLFRGIEGLCIMLKRLAYPNRLCDMSIIFNRPKPTLSLIISRMIDFVYGTHSHLLDGFDKWWLKGRYLSMYADAIHEAGAPFSNCIGFIDGTTRSLCRPIIIQRELYNGHKRTHCIKYQSIVTPNGLISSLYEPVSGRRHDSFMLSESGLLPQLEQLIPNHCLYGDPAYPLRPQLQAPFRSAKLTEDQQDFNTRMSAVRVCVEWEFGKVINNFAFLDFENNLKLFLQPVAKYYVVGVIMTNCHTCLNGSQTSKKFKLNPPNLDDYLNKV